MKRPPTSPRHPPPTSTCALSRTAPTTPSSATPWRTIPEDDTIDDLLDSHVKYTVTKNGWTLSAATKGNVDAHYRKLRPAETWTPQRDLTVTEMTELRDIGFDDWTAFGFRILRLLKFPPKAMIVGDAQSAICD